MGRSRSDLEAALERAVLRAGLRVRRVGDRRRVLDVTGGRVHEIGGVAVRALDLLRAGRPVEDPEVVAGLVAAGIADVPGLPRRDVLGYVTAASLGISTVLLPAAVAAASPADPSVSGSDGELQQFTVTSDSGTVSYLLYRLAHTSLIAAPIERTFIIGTVARSVQMLLVGAGGSGGVADEIDGTQVLAGGGGGGEVVEVDLGTVPAGTELAVSVAGSPAATSGDATYVRIGGQQLVEAKGGGQGAGLDFFGAFPGGSGGGGSSTYPTAGTSSSGSSATVGDVTPSITSSRKSDGGAGGSSSGGGGGGGGGAGGAGVAGSSGSGGAGGGGTDISAFFLDYVVSASSDPGDFITVVGGGGGGAGLGLGSGGYGPGGGGGGGYLETSPFLAFQGQEGWVGTGGGGGGGASGTDGDNAVFGVPGQGGTGLAWVRIRTS